MSKGQPICAFSKCRSRVDFGDGILDDGLWYHTDCYYLMLRKEAEKLQKKFGNKTITLEEAERLEDILPLIDRVNIERKKPTITMAEIMAAPSKPVFMGKSEGLQKIAQFSADVEDYEQRHPMLTGDTSKKQLAGCERKLLE